MSLLVCWAAASCPPPRGLAPTPDNSSPTGTSGHFHMELLLQGVGATWRHLLLGRGLWSTPCPHTWAPGSMVFLLSLLITPGPLLLWAKSRLNPRSAHKAGRGSGFQLRGSLCPLRHPHPLSPSSVFPPFIPNPSGATVPGLAAAASLLCPLPTLPAETTGQRDTDGQLGLCRLQGPLNAQIP